MAFLGVGSECKRCIETLRCCHPSVKWMLRGQKALTSLKTVVLSGSNFASDPRSSAKLRGSLTQAGQRDSLVRRANGIKDRLYEGLCAGLRKGLWGATGLRESKEWSIEASSIRIFPSASSHQ